ncbi:Z1 domain-containing protein [Arthrobacter sp. 49Tsu3.1M3]|uniref:Z1 domain-containing protein n=1 Tax=Arthrobacter sp. 49Tsu3.1M3 TaxID=1279029 RepID=UPI0009A70586|nr:Z1 domain-containing protein [Arthrobacter sp. 49Tsu3.1M3]SKB73596.1 Z1 domain-containing protein [Arthrobacter sp. 49Tsu3.1M3]
MTHLEETRAQEAAQLERMLKSQLVGGALTEEMVNTNLKLLAGMFGKSLGPDDLAAIVQRIQAAMGISMDRGTVLTAEGYEPWVKQQRGAIDWQRWTAYQDWLVNEKGISPRVVQDMGVLTDDILDLVGDPHREGAWNRVGLVLGDVQSGKTGTYLGLFNKAIDAGYRLIVVLGGHTGYLRQQTQKRVDEGVVGMSKPMPGSKLGTDASPEKYVGIGVNNRELVGRVAARTSVWSDFNSKTQQTTMIHVGKAPDQTFVFVVKKNKAILQSLVNEFEEQTGSNGKLELPMILLDDESDYASVDTSKEEDDPTVINALIRELLTKFERSSYIGFSATPFANIFIDSDVKDDLFPKDYIYALEAPSNYVGADKVFSSTDGGAAEQVVDLTDADEFFPPKHKASLSVTGIPESLREAIRTYLIANAIRDIRGNKDEARAMLVNVSRFINVQDQVITYVTSELTHLQNTIGLNTKTYASGQPNKVLDQLKETHAKHYANAGVTWEQVLAALPSAVADITPVVINSSLNKKNTAEPMSQKRRPRQIVVGGDVLSRGLTLDGLMVSYFFRHATATDTLLQMARWFGYREGYEDLCRVWITAEQADNFAYIDRSVKELRADLISMHNDGYTPEDFGVAVRKHPGAMLITARNKMKTATEWKVRVSFSGRSPETTKLSARPSHVKSNYAAAEKLILAIEEDSTATYVPREKTLSHRWTDVDRQHVADFLGAFTAHFKDFQFSPALERHVRSGSHHDNWDVVFMAGTAKAPTREIGDRVITLNQRTIGLGDESYAVAGSSRRLGGRSDFRLVADAQSVSEMEKKYAENNTSANPPESEYIRILDRPVLFIYGMDPNEIEDNGSGHRKPKDPVVAIKLAFPHASSDPSDETEDVEYMITKSMLRKMMGPEDLEGASDE